MPAAAKRIGLLRKGFGGGAFGQGYRVAVGLVFGHLALELLLLAAVEIGEPHEEESGGDDADDRFFVHILLRRLLFRFHTLLLLQGPP